MARSPNPRKREWADHKLLGQRRNVVRNFGDSHRLVRFEQHSIKISAHQQRFVRGMKIKRRSVTLLHFFDSANMIVMRMAVHNTMHPPAALIHQRDDSRGLTAGIDDKSVAIAIR